MTTLEEEKIFDELDFMDHNESIETLIVSA